MKPTLCFLAELQLRLPPTEADPNLSREGNEFCSPSVLCHLGWPAPTPIPPVLQHPGGSGGNSLAFLPKLSLPIWGRWTLLEAYQNCHVHLPPA